MILNKNAFFLDLRKFGAKTKKQAELIFRKVVLDLDQRVVLGTPVDKGTARANWNVSVNVPNLSNDTEKRDPSGSGSIGEVQRTAALAALGDVIWLVNSLPYILPLEEGHSKQAPNGMVRINVRAISATYGNG